MHRPPRLVALALSVGLLALSGSAGAATSTGYATFTALAGGSGAYTSTVQLPGVGYPAATLASTSAGGAGVQSGASSFLPASSPPGAQFGSSLNQPYVTIATAAAKAPSVTTYSFATPAPIGWGFVLGDVDADQVQVAATKADGSAASAAELGFQGAFNYAGGANVDQPTWNATTATLVGSGVDTTGASGWFVPTVPLRSLRLTFSLQTGSPTFQTWFASVSRGITGTVSTATGCDVTAASVRLLDAAGAVLASVHPAPGGGYAFPSVAATDAFSVDLTGVPPGCQASGPASRTVDLRTTDAVADFAIANIPAPAPAPAPTGTLAGTVTDRSGGPVEDAVVVVRDAAATEVARDATGPGGHFTVAALPVGPLTATVRPPRGYVVVGDPTRPLVVPAQGGPLTLDFVVRPRVGAGTATAAAPVVLPEVGGVPAPLPWLGVLLLVLGGALASVPRRRH